MSNNIRRLLMNLVLLVGGVVLWFLAGYPHRMLSHYTEARIYEQTGAAPYSLLIGPMFPFFHLLAFLIVLLLACLLNRGMSAGKRQGAVIVLRWVVVIGIAVLSTGLGCYIETWCMYRSAERSLPNEVPQVNAAPASKPGR